jgi:NADPH:quinone reductase-like Zn-dependent oxidoreductase
MRALVPFNFFLIVLTSSTALMGAFAEYVIVDEGSVAVKPASLSFVDAACLPTSGMFSV